MLHRKSYTGTELKNYLIATLRDKWGAETDALSRYVLREVLDVGMYEMVRGTSIDMDEGKINHIEGIVSRLNEGEPIQYILGYAYFLERKFMVNRHVLIPRPETEELVLLTIQHLTHPNPRILDIGVGSGCIGISLALETDVGTFTGVDNDTFVLEVARQNCAVWNIQMTPLKIDVLKEGIPATGFDIIISNPPYVLPSEKDHMKEHVLNYEPSRALFVPEENPLIFYERITKESERILNPQGMLIFEINESFGPQVQKIILQHHYSKVLIAQDIHGKDRFVFGKR